MPTIKSSADLQNNYNEISTFCHNCSLRHPADAVNCTIYVFKKLPPVYSLFHCMQGV